MQRIAYHQLSEKFLGIQFRLTIRVKFMCPKREVYIVSVTSNVFNNCAPFSDFQTPAYIGMSTDLRKRFDAHTAGQSADALWRRLGSSLNHCTFWYGIFQDKSTGELRKIEQALIDVYGSPLNRINSVKIGETINANTL